MACPMCGTRFYSDFKFGNIDKEVGLIMKIAVPAIGDQIDQDFDNCKNFTIFTIEGNVIRDEENIKSSVGSGYKFNVSYLLAQSGVAMLIAGNIGDGAINVLATKGIRTIKGASGTAKNAVESFLRGELRG